MSQGQSRNQSCRKVWVGCQVAGGAWCGQGWGSSLWGPGQDARPAADRSRRDCGLSMTSRTSVCSSNKYLVTTPPAWVIKSGFNQALGKNLLPPSQAQAGRGPVHIPDGRTLFLQAGRLGGVRLPC